MKAVPIVSALAGALLFVPLQTPSAQPQMFRPVTAVSGAPLVAAGDGFIAVDGEEMFLESDLFPLAPLPEPQPAALLSPLDIARSFLGLAAALPPANAAPPPIMTRSGMLQAINSSQIVSNARSLLGVPYLWGGNSAGGMDCSAFVSRAWGIGRNTTDTLPGLSIRISKDELRQGDALNLTKAQDPRGLGHVRLFDRWANTAHTAVWVYEETPPRAVYRAIRYDDRYTPIRRLNYIAEPEPADAPQLVMELSPEILEDADNSTPRQAARPTRNAPQPAVTAPRPPTTKPAAAPEPAARDSKPKATSTAAPAQASKKTKPSDAAAKEKTASQGIGQGVTCCEEDKPKEKPSGSPTINPSPTRTPTVKPEQASTSKPKVEQPPATATPKPAATAAPVRTATPTATVRAGTSSGANPTVAKPPQDKRRSRER